MIVFHVMNREYAADAPVPSAAYSRAGVVWCLTSQPDAEEWARANRTADGPGNLWRGTVDLTGLSARTVKGGENEADESKGYYERAMLETIRSGVDVVYHKDGIVALAPSVRPMWELLGPVDADPHPEPQPGPTRSTPNPTTTVDALSGNALPCRT